MQQSWHPTVYHHNVEDKIQDLETWREKRDPGMQARKILNKDPEISRMPPSKVSSITYDSSGRMVIVDNFGLREIDAADYAARYSPRKQKSPRQPSTGTSPRSLNDIEDAIKAGHALEAINGIRIVTENAVKPGGVMQQMQGRGLAKWMDHEETIMAAKAMQAEQRLEAEAGI